MYITPQEYASAFRSLKQSSLINSTCLLVVFVACLSIDSVCAAKVLSGVFKKNLIQYQLIPVAGYADLKEHYTKLDSDVANVILVGCGAMVDLEDFLGASTDRKIYVIDGNRPWNLDNLFGLDTVVCLDDGFIDANLERERESYKVLVTESDEESGAEGGVESEGEGAGEGQESIGDKRPSEESRGSKRRKLSETILQLYYNQGTAVFTANTAIVYALLSNIGETSIENLWLSIIGASALDKMYPEVYDKVQPLFRDEVHRLNPEKEERNADTNTLSIEKDYHLFLLRHWTLYDSFLHSSLVNSKLNLWTEDGRKKLHKLFAKMGVLLSVAQQKWLYMDTAVKRNLPVIFGKYLSLYGLEGIVREGFVRTFGYTAQLLAMECVEALTALLETEEEPKEGDIEKNIERREKTWVANFWRTWDALNMGTAPKKRGYELLLAGLEQAKAVQQLVFKTGMSVLERKVIKNLRLYRLCVLNGGTPELETFRNPLVLARLGNWLLENLTEIELSHEKMLLKPLIVASLDPSTDLYLVIGLPPKYPRAIDLSLKAKLQRSSTTRLNTFSVAFQKVADSLGAKVRINSFEAAVIEVRKDDLAPFLERLTLSGLL